MTREHSRKKHVARARTAEGQKGVSANEATANPTSRRLIRVICALLFVTTLSLYGRVIRHPFTNFDDGLYVTENQHVGAGLSVHTIVWALTATDAANWHPLTWLSHALDSQLYGMNAGGHHISSALLHALNAVLLFLLLARATGSTARSAVVAALFAFHPLNVESVAWIAERKNVLSMFFFLLALGAYGWYVLRPNWKRYAIVAILFAMGLASKPMVITLPCVLLLLDHWPLHRVRGWEEPSMNFPVAQVTWPQLIVEKIPLLAFSAASAIITVIAQRSGSAVVAFGDLPFRVRAQNALYSYGLYLVKLFWPVHLAIFYPHPYPLGKLTFARVALSAAFLIAVTLWVWLERIRRPYLVTGWLWFVGTMVPVIGLIQVGEQGMADRYIYLPAIGFFLMLVWSASDWAEERALRFGTVAAVTATVLALLFVLSFRQIGFWRSNYDLWAHTLDVTQDNYIADDKMGDLLMRQGRPEAINYYEAAAKIERFDPISHGILASNLQDRGDFPGAIREYNIVLRAGVDDSVKAHTYVALAVIYREIGDYPSAREASKRALLLDPEIVHGMVKQLSDYVAAHPDAPACYQLGLLLEGAGQLDQARSSHQQALRLNPQFDPARKALDALGDDRR
jgi:tetratricopeptide (TPR) repeat protein